MVSLSSTSTGSWVPIAFTVQRKHSTLLKPSFLRSIKKNQSAWEIVRSLVVGYIEEEEEEEEGDEEENNDKSVGKAGEAAEETQPAAGGKEKNRAFRIAGKAVLMQARGTAAVAGRGQSTFELVIVSCFFFSRLIGILCVSMCLFFFVVAKVFCRRGVGCAYILTRQEDAENGGYTYSKGRA